MEKVANNLSEISYEKELVLKKHVGLIHCENKLTLLQRKICNILLFNALDKISEDIHEISIRKLCSLIGYNSNDVSLIKQSLKKLMSIVMEWNLLDDTKFLNEKDLPVEMISWHASTLLAGVSIERGVLYYSYSPQIKAVISSLEIYGRINLFIQAKFNSSYTLVLYENCVRFKNIAKTSWFTLKLFRALMGVSPDNYESFKELKRNVITPAITEINQKSDIYLKIEYKKAGRQITSVRFIISENENYKPQFKRLNRTTETSKQIVGFATVHEVLISEFQFDEKQITQILKNYDAAYVLEKINFIKKQKNIGNKKAYLISALKNDYKQQNKMNSSSNTAASSHILRERQEASKISGYYKKYMQYKFESYKLWTDKQPYKEMIYAKFNEYIRNCGNILVDLYRRKEFNTPLIIAEFIQFLENNYDNLLPKCLALDEYLTSEEEQTICL